MGFYIIVIVAVNMDKKMVFYVFSLPLDYISIVLSIFNVINESG